MGVTATNDIGSDNDKSFGFKDFDESRVGKQTWTGCPIRGCDTQLDEIERPATHVGKPRKPFVFCRTHGIRLHSNTFVYWNGSKHVDQARLRNFAIHRELAGNLVFGKSGKVESGRLGSEMSEDALSWNVFVGLAEAGKLRKTLEFLTRRTVSAEPQLYLWGIRVNTNGSAPERFAPLDRVRTLLERDIGNYKTEPDIMLIVPGLVVCIEAKFGSGNPLAHVSDVKVGDKPTALDALVKRYLGAKSLKALEAIDSEKIGGEFHSQLFRNIVFAAEMADGAEWHVVNLVSSSQWHGEKNSPSHSFASPVPSVRSYLRDDHAERFDFRTWEQMHAVLVAGDSSLTLLDRYLRTKSAHFQQAFKLDSKHLFGS